MMRNIELSKEEVVAIFQEFLSQLSDSKITGQGLMYAVDALNGAATRKECQEIGVDWFLDIFEE